MTKPREVLILQHADCETPGLIADALSAANLQPRPVRLHRGEPLPALGDCAGLVVMGGPQSVYEQDRFPFLTAELRLLEEALKQKRPILGTCLGSQLLAAALGANVRPGPRKEIGWHELTLSPEAKEDPLLSHAPEHFTPVHWHGDIFDLPAGATRLASSQLTANQAFRYGSNAYAFLFHMELTDAMLREWVRVFAGELSGCGIDGQEVLRNAAERFAPVRAIGTEVYRKFSALCAER